AILSADTGGGPAVFIIAAVFAALILRDVMWKRSRRGAIAWAQAALSGEEDLAEPPPETETPDDVVSAAAEPPVGDDPQLRAIENEAQQVLELLGAAGGSRDSIRDSVDATVAKARELTARRERLERMLADPDLADLDERIGDLERRIDETGDEETAEVYRRTLDQLRSQAASLADVRVMMERLEAYLNASLQSLRTIHIDLLRLQTGDLDDPDRTLDDISARAGNLGEEIKSVREVVEEVQRHRRAHRATQRQI
ncbi:MAG: hypothetical protein QGH45_17065, partial [Myxococcota bacterium]|nr:hypothetical protein [Myxococcota bacterium]